MDKRKLLILRRVFQVIFFTIFLPIFLPLFYCPYQVPWVMCDSCPVGWCPSKYMRKYVFFFLAGSAILFGRFFCGWVCPLGSMQDGIAAISRKVSGKEIDIKGKQCVKFVFLGGFLFFLLHATGTIRVVSLPSISSYMPAVIFLILFISSFVPRFWCRFVCPVGALLSLFNKVSVIKIKVKEKCSNCGICENRCDMKTGRKRIEPDSTDCIRCMECYARCPDNAIKIGVRGK